MVCSDYNVFISHRGPDTKHNIVSVLHGMLRLKGIRCFVDYKMHEGSDLSSAIKKAIESSLVHIVILSKDFRSSAWCLNEVIGIMNMQEAAAASRKPFKVVPVFYNVKFDNEDSFLNENEPNVKRSTKEERENWTKALKGLLKHTGFEYDSKTAYEWEELDNIVVEVEAFLISNNILPQKSHHREKESTWELDMRRHYNSVFICHKKEDTQRNAVSVLRGMLRSGGITCFVAGYDKEETEMKFDMIEAIRKSRVHVIFLSPTFVRSKQCLEQIVEIMSVRDSADSSARQGEVKVLPVFYDVEPYMVRYQIKHYDLCNVEGSSKERWANALTSLSHLKGLEYVTSAEDRRFQHFQWETLHKIARKVEACLRKDAISCNNGGRHDNFYKEKLNQVFEAWKSKDSKSKDVFVVGVYERKKSQFPKLMVEEFASRRFDAISILSNVMEKLSHPDGPSLLVWKLYSDLTGKLKEEQPSLDDITIFRRHYDQLLRNKRCLVVLNDLGNDIDNLKPLLEIVIENLKNRSLVVLISRFQRVLQKDVKLDIFISLSSLYDNKGILTICYGNKGDIHEAFLDQLQETFSMLGLDIHLESKEGLSIESTVFQNSEVVLCIVSQSLSIDEFEGMLSNAGLHRPRVVYVLYGAHPTDESTSKPCNFKIKVDFQESELNKKEFKMMVNEVLQTLKEGREEIKEAADFPVSLTERVNEMWAQMSSSLSSSNNALQCFGLLGMGGSGKTTTAMSIYNKIHKQFEGSFFSLNTRARVAADASSLISLQRKILQSLLFKIQYDDGRTENAAHGKSRLPSSTLDFTEDEVHGKALLSRRLRSINALVVLDDVDSILQLEALYNPLCSALGPNSVVIITSRDHDILQHAQVTQIFYIQALSTESSRRLFNWHAFLRPEGPPHLQEVSESVISACKGLPLSLKIMGAHLYHQNDERYWHESLNYLRKNEKLIMNVLKRSLDGLESDQIATFLDISCFFVGESDVVSLAYLEGVYGEALTHLKFLNSRCLLTFEREEGMWWKGFCDTKGRTIEMHDILRDMGRQVVGKEEKNRAWDEDSAKDLLKHESARSALCGLSINSSMALPYEAAKCESLPELKLLRLIGDSRDGESLHGNKSAGNILKNVRCEELRLLVWRNASFGELPPGLCSVNLRVLDLRDSNIGKLPPRACFMELRYLDLAGTNISSVPPGISFVHLEHMDLSCTKIKELPSGVCCPNLKRLYLWKTEISELPDGLCSTNLEILRLKETNISKVPEALLPKLLLLDLQGCKRLESLPTKFGALMTSLQLLHLSECERIEGLDSSIGSLADLRSLLLRGCHRMTRLPQEITRLSSLEFLDLQRCTSLESLSFLPTTLQKLRLNGCSSLQTVNASLPNLQQLYTQRCTSLKALPTELGPSMRELWLMGCDGVEELLATNQASFFRAISCLEVLDLQQCTSLETLSFLPTTLQKLYMNGCSSLLTVNASLPNLQQLYAQHCTRLKELPTELGASMRELLLFGCDGVAKLLATNQASFFGGLSSLEILDLRECTCLDTLSFLSTTLQKLWLNGCSNLHTVNASLPNLEELYAARCHNLKALPTELGASMRELVLERCDALGEWLTTNQPAFFRGLCSLKMLDLSFCTSLKRLSILPTSLEKLILVGCIQMEVLDLESGSLMNLKELDIRHCPRLRSLPPEIESLPSLTIIRNECRPSPQKISCCFV